MKHLLLHICCGPCATAVIERLGGEYDITGYFYNPNIHREDEYARRLEAAREVAHRTGITMIEGDYDPDRFFACAKGIEGEPENGRRCLECYRLRLGETARTAAKEGFGVAASTLTIGPMKKAAVIDPVGCEAAEQAGLTFLEGDWKKNDGFRRSCILSKEYGIYRQHYCGCIFSMEREDREP